MCKALASCVLKSILMNATVLILFMPLHIFISTNPGNCYPLGYVLSI